MSTLTAIERCGAFEPKRVDGRMYIEIRCSGCPATAETPARPGYKPEAAAKKFAQNGWRTKAPFGRALCPRCAKARKEPKVTKAAAINNRQMFRLLDQFFDAEKGCYTNGYSDERIAKETKLALEYVARTRTEAYGALQDPEVVKIGTDIAALRAEIGRERDELKKLAETTASDFQGRLAELEKRLQRVESK